MHGTHEKKSEENAQSQRALEGTVAQTNEVGRAIDLLVFAMDDRERESGKKIKKNTFPLMSISTHLNLIFLLHLYSIPHSLVIIPHFDSPVMSSNDKPTVLIVGAGLGGLMLGALLEKSNVPYTIFERAAMVKPLGR